MSVNTPASWSGQAALRGLTRLNVILTSATEKENPQSLVAGRVGGTVFFILIRIGD
jgi:hypothetical protein